MLHGTGTGTGTDASVSSTAVWGVRRAVVMQVRGFAKEQASGG